MKTQICSESMIMRLRNRIKTDSILEELRFCTARVPNNADIYIPSQVDAFMSELVNATNEHKKDSSLYVLMTKHCWSNAIDKLIEEIRGTPHSLNFINLFSLLQTEMLEAAGSALTTVTHRDCTMLTGKAPLWDNCSSQMKF